MPQQSGPCSILDFFLGGGGVHELFVFITRGSRVFYYVYDRYYQPPDINNEWSPSNLYTCPDLPQNNASYVIQN